MRVHIENLEKQFESTITTTHNHAKALEPQPYVGECDAMLIENLLWDLQCYMDTSTSSKAYKVFLISLYLKNTWRPSGASE